MVPLVRLKSELLKGLEALALELGDLPPEDGFGGGGGIDT